MRRTAFTLAVVVFLMLTAVVPVAAAPVSGPSAAAACGATYTVVYGDTLARIAQRCGVTLTALLRANPQITNANRIFVGQRINIPGGTTPPPPPVTPGPGATYIVRAGDTLARIAAQFRTTVSAILAANRGITNANRIYVGQRITIPGATPPSFTQVQIALISLGTGNIGCGDGVALVRRDVPATTAPLTAAIRQLVSLRDQYYGQSGLYNALYQSNLQVQSVSIDSAGRATIRLTGTIVSGGACDAPRIQAQFERTARQFATVRSVQVLVNGRALSEVLSSR
jgi:LysM repeat protein